MKSVRFGKLCTFYMFTYVLLNQKVNRWRYRNLRTFKDPGIYISRERERDPFFLVLVVGFSVKRDFPVALRWR